MARRVASVRVGLGESWDDKGTSADRGRVDTATVLNWDPGLRHSDNLGGFEIVVAMLFGLLLLFTEHWDYFSEGKFDRDT